MQKLTAIFLLAAACGGRTTAATQPAPASYDPSKNDPKAVALADKMVAALGGAEQWAAVKQLSFAVHVELNGELRAVYHHDWDRWNARHRFELITLETLKRAEAANDEELVEQSVVMYKLFDRDSGAGYFGQKHKMDQRVYTQELSTEQRREAIETAFSRWEQDAYMVSLPFRLRDPGVYLKHDGERSDEYCPGTCEVIAVTFDPSVGKDKYWINVDTATSKPVMVEWDKAGGQGRIAYQITEWRQAGGLQFVGVLDNVGARNMGDSEVWKFLEVEIGDPDDSLYIPQVL